MESANPPACVEMGAAGFSVAVDNRMRSDRSTSQRPGTGALLRGRWCCALLLVVVLTGCQQLRETNLCYPASSTTHINDLCVHDPCILADTNSRTYYIYRHFSPRRWADTSSSGTNSAGVQAFWSTNLVEWFGPTNVFEIPDGFWADNDGPWAPEVHAYRGKYYLFTTFNAWKERMDERPGRPFINKRASQILVADSPLGPFKPFANHPHTPDGLMTLDATFWVENGQPWMVYAHEWVQLGAGTIEAIRLRDDLSGTVGEPVVLFSAAEVSWAKTNINYRGTNYAGIVTDGPWLHRRKDGRLLMFWSSWSHTNAYAQAVAVSDSGRLAGPWRHIEPPLLWDDRGHGMVFRDFDGRLLLCLHRYFHQPKTRVQIWELEEGGEAVLLKGQMLGAP